MNRVSDMEWNTQVVEAHGSYRAVVDAVFAAVGSVCSKAQSRSIVQQVAEQMGRGYLSGEFLVEVRTRSAGMVWVDVRDLRSMVDEFGHNVQHSRCIREFTVGPRGGISFEKGYKSHG
jgi:hypothetical protein